LIVIISKPDDGHIPFVTKHLRTPPILIDAGTVLGGESLTYHLNGRGVSAVTFRGKQLSDVTGVWLRRPRLAKSLHDIPVEDRFKAYCQSALHWHIQQLYTQFPDAFWLPNYFSMVRAENKMLQLSTAASVGFRTPETLLTSSGNDARLFVKRKSAVITKPISRHGLEVVPAGSTSMLVLYAHRLSDRDAVNDDALRVAPTIFQEMIEPLFDIRVTVVGASVFAAKIISPDLPTTRDWRTNNKTDKLHIEAYELQPNIAKMCVALTKRLGLHYGAIDLVQGNDGDPYFLEINPNGQWAFVEQETRQPIGKAIARFLEQGAPQ
jgi:glutathione synthase/RimK-type ligase-like ATP-grasp enzyme